MEIWANIGCKICVLGSVASKIEACSVCWEGFWWAKGALGDPWGSFQEHLGTLGVIWGPLGAIWTLEASWVLPCGPLRLLGGSLGVPGGYSGPFGIHFGGFWDPKWGRKVDKKVIKHVIGKTFMFWDKF